MKGVFLGSVHRSGVSKEGKEYSFYTSFFSNNESKSEHIGQDIFFGTHNEPFPELSEKNLGCEFNVYSFMSKGRTFINGVSKC